MPRPVPGSFRWMLAAIAATVLLAAPPAFPQATTGEITGRVLDSGGAAVPGATVAARNEGTGLTRQATTNAYGEYTITQLPPGNYAVSAELTGFKKVTRRAVPVNVGIARDPRLRPRGRRPDAKRWR